MTNYKKFDIIKGFYQIFLKKFAFYQKFCYNERIKARAVLNFGKIFVKNLLRRAGLRKIGREEGSYGALALILARLERIYRKYDKGKDGM